MKKNGILSRLFLVLMFLFLYAPIFVLIVFSFNDSKSNAVWGGFTLDWYAQLLENRTVEQGYLPEPKKKAFEGAPRASSGYKRLVELGDALAALIRRSRSRDNKTLADFAESLRKILEKFNF